MSHDAIVIGAGVNGLVAAHRLARAGRRVLVLEQHPDLDTTPDVGWVPASVIEGLQLDRHGLVIERADPWLSVALPDGGRLDLSRSVSATADAIRRVSPADAARWPDFCQRMHRLAHVLELLYTQPAPDVETTSPGELLRLARTGFKVRRQGKQAIIDLLRLLPMSLTDLLDEWFTHDALKGALAMAGIQHLRQGPRSGGTTFSFLHHHAGSAPGVFRQATSNISQVLAKMPGIQVRRGAAVANITIKAGAVTGVALAGGEHVAAPLVVSNADPRATLLGLVDADWLDPEFALAVRNIKCRGVAAQVRLSVTATPSFTRLAIAPSLEYLERAYDDAKYGRVSARPCLEAVANGDHVDIHAQYVPYTLAGGPWDDPARRALGDLVVRTLAEQVPGIEGTISATEVMTPHDMAVRTGLTEGHRYHGELTLDQILFMRPVAGWSRYHTPVGGLFLCGAGTHPGGGIAGGSGWLAGKVILKDSTA